MINPGQTIYVATNSFLGKGEKIEEYVVTEINSVSFYAYKKDSKRKSPIRFNKKTMKSKAYGYEYVAYLDEDHFNEVLSRRREERDLREAIMKNINDLSLEQLRFIYSYINVDSSAQDKEMVKN